MGCVSERSRSRSTGPYQSTGTPRTRCGSSPCLADGSTPRGIPKTLLRSSRSLAIGQPLWCRGWPGTRRAYAYSMTRPRVTDKRTDPVTGERQRFSSAILPAWARKTPKITEVLPLLYLHGLSSGDFVPALGQFLGSAAGLSAAVITQAYATCVQSWLRPVLRAAAARVIVLFGGYAKRAFGDLFGIQPGSPMTGPVDVEGDSRMVLQLQHP